MSRVPNAGKKTKVVKNRERWSSSLVVVVHLQCVCSTRFLRKLIEFFEFIHFCRVQMKMCTHMVWHLLTSFKQASNFPKERKLYKYSLLRDRTNVFFFSFFRWQYFEFCLTTGRSLWPSAAKSPKVYILENISKSCWAGTEQIRSPRKRPVNEGGWRVSVQREKRKRRKKEKRNELKILLGGQIDHVKVVSKTGSGLCGSASWECFEDAIASSIGCYGVAQDSGSNFFFF